jgi:hypothetical protein
MIKFIVFNFFHKFNNLILKFFECDRCGDFLSFSLFEPEVIFVLEAVLVVSACLPQRISVFAVFSQEAQSVGSFKEALRSLQGPTELKVTDTDSLYSIKEH